VVQLVKNTAHPHTCYIRQDLFKHPRLHLTWLAAEKSFLTIITPVGFGKIPVPTEESIKLLRLNYSYRLHIEIHHGIKMQVLTHLLLKLRLGAG